MKFFAKAFLILFFSFFNIDFLNAGEINCSSPVHKNKIICRRESELEPKIDPKELIEKLTVLIVGVKGINKPGSGVIVNKKDNIYSVLTAAHVVCNLSNQISITKDYEVKTSDGYWHNDSNYSSLKVYCPPILKDKKEKFGNKLCSVKVNESYPWPIDIAVLEFKSDKEYMVAKRPSSIKNFGKDVYISGYSVSGDGKFLISESQGTVDLPSSSINGTCKGYGLRYLARTEIGMDGGGVWSKKGKLVGIHGYREVSRRDDLVLNRGSHGIGIHIPYWKQLVDPLDPSKGFPEGFGKNDNEVDSSALISRAKAFINVNRSEFIEDNPFLSYFEESTEVLEDLKRAEIIEKNRALIPALKAQIYIRRYEDDQESPKQIIYLTDALKNINRAIKLQKPAFISSRDSYDGSFQAIRAYVHFLYGQHINNQDSILSYRFAIKNIDERLSLKPDDVESWKDKAKYHYSAKDLDGAYYSLIRASKLAPNDPSIFIDKGIIFAANNENGRACKDFNRAGELIDKGLLSQKRGFSANDFKLQKARLDPWKNHLGC